MNTERMAALAERFNIQVWHEAAAEIVCAACDSSTLAPRSQADADASCPSCNSGETTVREPSADDRRTHTVDGDRGPWWWQTCSPGCLPDSDVMGPFKAYSDALEDATEGLDDGEGDVAGEEE